jgi:pectate lyase
MNILLLAAALLLAPIYQAEAQAKFDIGDRVKQIDPNGANVRATPAGTLIGTQPLDAQGKVLEGPTVAGSNNITWYNIDWDAGVDGWVGEADLEEVVTPTPPAKFVVGDRVLVTDPDFANVRDAPAGALVGTQPTDAQGSVTAGPVVAGVNNITWYQVNWDTGVDGWTGQDDLEKVGAEPPPPPPPPEPLSAFPGAQGAGAVSKGGRGGAVHMVTSMANSGAGTLRACVEASGPRTCVFRRGGTINLSGSLFIRNPNLTIAGQTAPGGGVQLNGAFSGNMILTFADEVIFRYVRVRHADACPPQGPGTECGGNVRHKAGTNVIYDHLTSQWNEDEGLAVTGTGRNVTFSNSITAEGAASHSTGALLENLNSTLDNFDFHHNLLMNNSHRDPQIDTGRWRVVNNIMYNNRLCSTQVESRSNGPGRTEIDFIGNFYKKGPLNLDHPEISGLTTAVEDNSFYLSGNKGWNQTDPNGDQWRMVRSGGINCSGSDPIAPTSWRRTTTQPAIPRPITAEPVDIIASPTGTLIPHIGASRKLNDVQCDGTFVMNRDAQDTKLINHYTNNTGISSLSETPAGYGGLPTLAAGTPCPDNDLDGMSNAWETKMGLNSGDAADRNGDKDGDGYTNLEEYIDGIPD